MINNIVKKFFISIGNSCYFRGEKNLYLKNNNCDSGPTQMFDYIMNDLNSILSILKTNDIKILFNMKNIRIDNCSNHICLINGSKFKSIHDVEKKRKKTIYEYKKDIQINFIEKYIRRYERFIDLLKNNNQNKFIFVYSDNTLIENDDNIYKIKEIINILINKYNLLNFKIIHLINHDVNIMNNQFIIEKKFDKFYNLKFNQFNEKNKKKLNNLLFKKLLEIYNY